ncbi:MAG: endonuclease/exonuclease/phosphatase family protein [Verrucomicrobia bacterium]|nr:endonuclease/exonuclease/phosphatase family protein [Verrucomicrobiota bacterium]
MRAVLINVRTENQRHDLVRSFLAETNPDFIVLEEVDSKWIAALAELKRTHPHSIVEAREDNFGIAFFSKLPIQRGETLFLGGAEIPSLIVRFDSLGGALTILATHPLPPGGPEYSRTRNAQLAAIPSCVAQERGGIVLLGDLNATPWCHPFRKLVVASGLKLGGIESGFHASWPVDFFPLRIPIDHCLINSNVVVTAEKTGPNIGSDHFPLVVDFKLRF